MPLKILWLYAYNSDYDFDAWLHLKYVRWVKENYPNIEIIAYGPSINHGYPDIAPIRYRATRLLKDIHNEFAFDAIIANTKSRMFDYYSPFTQKSDGLWLPKDFTDFKVPKIMVEEDYQYEQNDYWYRDIGFNLMLQRHYTNSLRKHTIPVKWFPFSVDINTFTPSKDPVKPKIAFFGNKFHEIYVDRRWACDRLGQYPELFDEYSESKIVKGQAYPDTLRQYSIGLVTSGIYNMTFAKMFEMAASGMALLVPVQSGYGIELLYTENAYETYHNHCFDIVDKVKYLLSNKELLKSLRENARKETVEKHSHEIRTNQLVEIIKCLL